jgi:transposase-like protein
MEAQAMTTEQKDLRDEIELLSARKATRRYPEELRARVAAYARRRMARGASAARVCRELDLGSPTLKRFLHTSSPAAGFVELQVADDSARQPAPAPIDRRPAIAVRGGCGVMVEGLGIDDVARLLRELSCSG